jgi:hypothetical protein
VLPFFILPPPGWPISDNGDWLEASRTVAVDIDNDGDKDLVVVWLSATFFVDNAPLQILMNKGNRVFVDETVKRVGKAPQPAMHRTWTHWYFAPDLNGDSCPDLLYPSNRAGQLPKDSSGIWLNNCQGYFHPVSERVRPKRYSYQIPVDYDGDNDMDMLSWEPRLIGLANNEGCAEGEGLAYDYIDFSVWLNVNEGDFKNPLIAIDGFEN